MATPTKGRVVLVREQTGDGERTVPAVVTDVNPDGTVSVAELFSTKAGLTVHDSLAELEAADAANGPVGPHLAAAYFPTVPAGPTYVTGESFTSALSALRAELQAQLAQLAAAIPPAPAAEPAIVSA